MSSVVRQAVVRYNGVVSEVEARVLGGEGGALKPTRRRHPRKKHIHYGWAYSPPRFNHERMPRHTLRIKNYRVRGGTLGTVSKPEPKQ